MTDEAQDEEEAPLRAVPRRRAKTITVAAAALFVLLGTTFPDAAAGCFAAFVVLMLVVHWPSRGASPRRIRAAEREVVWPGRGMKAVVEAFQEPAFIVDRFMLLRYRNPASLIAFGNMALGDPVSLRFRSPELLAVVERVIEHLQPGLATLEDRRPLDRTWQVEVVPIPPYQGERPHFFLMLFRDRTAELRLERMRTDFVANASHELRTPLASLTGFIETLQGPARNDAAARDRFLDIMREQATRMSRLIDDLLSLSRIEMKRHVPISTTADLAALFRKVEAQMRPLAEQRGLTIELIVPDEPVLVIGDEDELMQVFANLVENACKYGDGGGRVEMQLARTAERGAPVINASVRDFGRGIAAEHVPRLTERFYRVDLGKDRSQRGTGLGLSIVRNILLRHRSRLLISSQVNEGSVFTARFPDPGKSTADSD
ncbi:ATP-binding protein [Aurantimonas endophytica]|uniref:histidine kinase n=1 Tax=Aurantimonas endophytica TaxID=1522175 RepID=A0A7W6HEZ2_9HYPH|nr:ATP-binding protein [Aurantimonas endophytica]MBB4003984.1 two-component system phosphate regulon sensor histidine kinase PhoR [Aurantimonas endophytica]MCO6404834.1 two-component sensor histidine kinase [Aurantimonas endophytica]